MVKKLILVICIISGSGLLFAQNADKISDSIPQKKSDFIGNKIEVNQYHLDGNDGPYIFGNTLFRVDSSNQLIKETINRQNALLVHVDNEFKDSFEVDLVEKHLTPKEISALPEKLLVISDVEGNYNAFSSFLLSNGVIDENYNWAYGSGHLVLLGDMVDRGKNVTQVLWLIYKLEQQAQLNDGAVHFILGNHEVLNFKGDYRYNKQKYIKVAQKISGSEDAKQAIQYMYSTRSEIGKWLSTKNVMEKVGNYLFVHAGLSPEILNLGLTVSEINCNVRKAYYQEENEYDKNNKFLYSTKGPFWYRGLVTNRPSYDIIESNQLNKILEFYEADKVVVGHTPVSTISSNYQGKVIMTDVSHGSKKFSGRTKGFLVEKGIQYSVDDVGNKTILE